MNHNRPMASRLLTFVVWALVAGSGLFWGLKLFVKAPGVPALAQTPARAMVPSGDLGRVLGVVEVASEDEETVSAPSIYRLLGVVAPSGASSGSSASSGVALIAVGDQPAKAWRTGAVVDGDTVLLSVGKRSAQLGPKGGPVRNELTLPEPAAASTGPAPGMMSSVRPQFPLAQGMPRAPGQNANPQGNPAAPDDNSNNGEED